MKIISIIPISIISLFSFFGLGMSSCGASYTPPTPSWKTDTILPPITTIGANTFGCRYNGTYWLAVPTKKISGSYSRGAVSISMNKSGDGKTGSITISSVYNSIFELGEYAYSRNIAATYTTTGKIYKTNDSNNVGYLNILKLDSVNRILSGTFEFEVHNPYVNPKKVSITSGRFDLKY